MSYIPFTVQKLDQETEEWADVLHLHARKVNRTGGGESSAAGAGQYHPRLTFELLYCAELEQIRYATQLYRIIYRGHTFNIIDYDDYMEQRLNVKLVGEAYG